jgi:hypothetical protein
MGGSAGDKISNGISGIIVKLLKKSTVFVSFSKMEKQELSI